ncbi:MAG: hypothetical protein KKF46_08535 [Nanoarchaeota archaeon]|nr:hypothetical protein [Nanoarchaeota archaeon]MBU1322376.1 hypothetical protein [Nanoarchaeota archaeon]MBU1598403.1 hypothetical protein [Nanoarchaeota archaeon]MBU2440780.1 hypothetical protein [Nanoarchaeota archaeon]
MALTEKQLQKLREIFDSCIRPLVLFDADPDGLASFLMIYKHIKDGRGVPVKNAPELGPQFAQKVNDYGPDLVVIVDMPIVSQDFINKIKAKIVWVDHHPVMERKGVMYFNPRLENPTDNRPTSYWIYRVFEENLWVGMIGMIGDWFMPEEEIVNKFRAKYPDLLPPEINLPEVALHNSKLGELINILAFNLKGMTSDVIKSVKIFTRTKDPYEILEQKTSGGKFVHKKYMKLIGRYNELLEQVKINPKDKLVVFVYQNPDISFSKELSNELIYKHPKKIILVAWEYGGEYKCSLRSATVNIIPIINKALEGLTGYGGGHEFAAGACVRLNDFDQFVENIKNQL